MAYNRSLWLLAVLVASSVGVTIVQFAWKVMCGMYGCENFYLYLQKIKLKNQHNKFVS